MFRTYMSRIEAGLGNPTLLVLHTMADALGVPISELFVPATTVPTKVRSIRSASRGRVR